MPFSVERVASLHQPRQRVAVWRQARERAGVLQQAPDAPHATGARAQDSQIVHTPAPGAAVGEVVAHDGVQELRGVERFAGGATGLLRLAAPEQRRDRRIEIVG